MPIAMDPARTADCWLDIDEPIAAETRPTFVCRFTAMGDKSRFSDILKAVPEADTDVAAYTLLVDAIFISLVGWRNMVDRDGNSVVFDPDTAKTQLLDLLTPMELWELSLKLQLAVNVTEEDLKKSVSQLVSATEKSVKDATGSTAKPETTESEPGSVVSDVTDDQA